MQEKNADTAIFFNGFLAFGSPAKTASKSLEIPKLLNDCG